MENTLKKIIVPLSIMAFVVLAIWLIGNGGGGIAPGPGPSGGNVYQYIENKINKIKWDRPGYNQIKGEIEDYLKLKKLSEKEKTLLQDKLDLNYQEQLSIEIDKYCSSSIDMAKWSELNTDLLNFKSMINFGVLSKKLYDLKRLYDASNAALFYGQNEEFNSNKHQSYDNQFQAFNNDNTSILSRNRPLREKIEKASNALVFLGQAHNTFNQIYFNSTQCLPCTTQSNNPIYKRLYLDAENYSNFYLNKCKEIMAGFTNCPQ
jgi:hypothetical protein